MGGKVSKFLFQFRTSNVSSLIFLCRSIGKRSFLVFGSHFTLNEDDFADNSLSSQNEKADDSKINDSVALSGANPVTNPNKTAIGASSAVTVNASSEKVKDNIKEETAALKD